MCEIEENNMQCNFFVEVNEEKQPRK